MNERQTRMQSFKNTTLAPDDMGSNPIFDIS